MKYSCLVSAIAAVSLSLSGCATEARMSRENDQARKTCFDSGLHVTDKQFWPCQVANQGRLLAADDLAECRSRGVQPGTSAMSQCQAALKKERSVQAVSDFNGYMAQMQR